MRPPSVGAPIDRVDGRLKVTGAAKYAAEFPVANAAHAVIVTSTIAKGRVTAMDTSAAKRVPGVITILTPFNAEKVTVPMLGPQPPPQPGAQGRPTPRPMRVPTVLQSNAVHYNGQPIGLVVADTFEHALEAAHLVKPSYASEKPVLDIAAAPKNPPETVHPLGGERVMTRGDVDRGVRHRLRHRRPAPCLAAHAPLGWPRASRLR